MLKIKFYNYHDDYVKIPEDKRDKAFINISPNINKIKKEFQPYKNYQNYILIGNGGSNTSFDSFWTALGKDRINKSVTIVTTMEPDYLYLIKSHNPVNDTLVIMISKSGDNVGILESFLYFQDYQKLIITSFSGTLYQLAKKNNWPVIEHPSVGGRFSGRSIVGYGPAFLLELDIEKIEKGAKNAVNNFQKNNNLPLKLAKFLFDQEVTGKTDIFMPVYSQFLEGFNRLITQLMHESTGKNGQGQTILAMTAPESQHHSNQRFFGGPKNMVGLFVSVERNHHKINIRVPKNCQNIPLRSAKMAILDGIDLNQSLKFEAQGTIEDAKTQGIPLAHILVDKITPTTVGELLVFWQFVAYYSAILRNSNPFDQPQVEKSKDISFTLRSNKTNNQAIN